MSRDVLIIAEIGSVHDGSLGNALKAIELAKNCGANAVKFQTHISEEETLENAPMPSYFKGEERFEYFKRTSFTKQQWQHLKDHADSCGIIFMSSPFSIAAVELLNDIGMEHYKIPSGEITNIPMLNYIAHLQKPILLSSGMSSWQEIDEAVNVIRQSHNNITILQCSSQYPCRDKNVGLNILTEMANRYNVDVGLSDHTLDNYAIFAAVTMGARVVEKHLTFSKHMYGSDAKHSAEPAQFCELVKGIRSISTMIQNQVDKDDLQVYREMKYIFQKSVISACNIKKGQIITPEMLAYKKPGDGIAASDYKKIIGKIAKKDIIKNIKLSWQDIENEE